jgi:hypothetical protein
LIGVEENPEFSPYGRSGLENDGFTPEFDTRRVSVNPMFSSSEIAASGNNNFTFSGGMDSTPTTQL